MGRFRTLVRIDSLADAPYSAHPRGTVWACFPGWDSHLLVAIEPPTEFDWYYPPEFPHMCYAIVQLRAEHWSELLPIEWCE